MGSLYTSQNAAPSPQNISVYVSELLIPVFKRDLSSISAYPFGVPYTPTSSLSPSVEMTLRQIHKVEKTRSWIQSRDNKIVHICRPAPRMEIQQSTTTLIQRHNLGFEIFFPSKVRNHPHFVDLAYTEIIKTVIENGSIDDLSNMTVTSVKNRYDTTSYLRAAAETDAETDADGPWTAVTFT
mgnify:CR=1 FL=1